MIDAKELLTLYKDGFPFDSDEYARYFINSVPETNVSVVKLGNRAVSAGYIVEKKAVLLDSEIGVGYLSALSTLSEFRGRGFIAGVIKDLLSKLSDGGAVFAALNPFNFEYYKKYGFNDASYCGKSVILGGRDYKIKIADKSDSELLSEIYSKYVCKFDFRQLADKKYFSDLIDELNVDDGKIFLVCDKYDKPFAYLCIDCGELTKFATLDDEEFSLINAFKGMTYEDFKRKDLAYIQMRIVNAEKLLSMNVYSEKNFEYVIRIEDKLLTVNNGIYAVGGDNGKITVRKLEDGFSGKVDKSIEIGELGKLFFEGKFPFKKLSVVFMDKF